MKNFIKKIFSKITIIVICFPILFGNIAISYVEETDSCVELIYHDQTHVNKEDLSNYMIEVKQVKTLSYETGIRAAFIEDNEPDGKESPVYYYVQAAFDIGEDTCISGMSHTNKLCQYIVN